MPVAAPVCWALSALALLAGAGASQPELSRGPLRPSAGCPGQGHRTGSATVSSAGAEPTELSVADFGATPNDGENDAPALRAALEACRRRGTTTLRLPPGRYDLREEDAVRLMRRAMSGAFGINPEPAIFRPYFPYARGLDFNQIAGVQVPIEVEHSDAVAVYENTGAVAMLGRGAPPTVRRKASSDLRRSRRSRSAGQRP